MRSARTHFASKTAVAAECSRIKFPTHGSLDRTAREMCGVSERLCSLPKLSAVPPINLHHLPSYHVLQLIFPLAETNKRRHFFYHRAMSRLFHPSFFLSRLCLCFLDAVRLFTLKVSAGRGRAGRALTPPFGGRREHPGWRVEWGGGDLGEGEARARGAGCNHQCIHRQRAEKRGGGHSICPLVHGRQTDRPWHCSPNPASARETASDKSVLRPASSRFALLLLPCFSVRPSRPCSPSPCPCSPVGFQLQCAPHLRVCG